MQQLAQVAARQDAPRVTSLRATRDLVADEVKTLREQLRNLAMELDGDLSARGYRGDGADALRNLTLSNLYVRFRK